LFCACSRTEETPVFSFVTRWEVKPSFKYDLACFIGIMTGREFYTRYYPELYAEWKKRLTPPANLALKKINEIIGNQTPTGPQLCLFFSAIPDSADNLAAILHFVEETNGISETSKTSARRDTINDQQWQALKPHLRILLEFLQKQNFQAYWEARLLPLINKQIPYTRQGLQAFDVIGDLERFLVDANFPDTVTVYVARLIQPHALRLSGQRYVAETSYPAHVTVKSAYHEIVHHYGDRVVDTLLPSHFKRLEDDSFLQLTVARIDQNNAYKNFKAFFHEEVTIAAELWLAERRRMISQIMRVQNADPLDPVRRYLAEQDDGRHVLAAVIYSFLAEGMKKENQSYAEFLRALFTGGRIASGRIEERYNKFMKVQ
jgi:hypothetical protein